MIVASIKDDAAEQPTTAAEPTPAATPAPTPTPPPTPVVVYETEPAKPAQ